MQLDVRGLTSPQATEIYLTATPTGRISIAEQGREIFTAIADLLRSRGAWIGLERIFAPRDAIEPLLRIRSEIYGKLDDGVSPSCLISPGHDDRLAAVQVYAIQGLARPSIVRGDGEVRGRQYEMNGTRWITASGLCAPEAGEASDQARQTFEKAQAILEQAGTDMRSVARTWIFMDDILSWYGPFNDARTGFFLERGVIGRNVTENRLPASTGIGVSPANRAKCIMDLYAAVGSNGTVTRFHSAGKQRSAYEYGSAFARASCAKSPAGSTVFVSGTAAIDPAGATCYLDDPSGQIQMTLENVMAVLKQMNCEARDVVHAIAYCANQQVKDLFEGCWAGLLPWPWVAVIGDVCRADLLFEVEATACSGAKAI